MGKQCTNDVKCCKIMSTSEREQAKPAHGERRMPIMNEVHDIMRYVTKGDRRVIRRVKYNGALE